MKKTDDNYEIWLREDGLWLKGAHLTALQAQKLESTIVDNGSESYESRVMLLAFFNRRSPLNVEHAHLKHLVWFIDNHPRQPLHEFVIAVENSSQFRIAKMHWLKQVQNNARDTKILNNAASFCSWKSPKTAERLWKSAWELDSSNVKWPWLLFNLHVVEAKRVHSANPKRSAVKAIEAAKAAIRLAQNDPKQSNLLSHLKSGVQEMTDFISKDAKAKHLIDS